MTPDMTDVHGDTGAGPAGTEIDTLTSHGIIPVVTIRRPSDAPAVAEALLEGGLPCLEVTLRTRDALEAIRMVHRSGVPVTLAAGTVLTPDQADAAVDAGASVLVAPGLNAAVAGHCRALGVPFIPGVATPSEVEAALARGLRTLKFFPAEALGGRAFLAALGGPYRAARFVPTGGIRTHNLLTYLALPNVAAVGGTWVAPTQLVDDREFGQISQLAMKAVSIVDRAREEAARPGTHMAHGSRS
jgi:2-dehydro-3-deoxyphosphogluconate aldolase/(4S)-4-hydroxy-2-oxoglutarate aldolase